MARKFSAFTAGGTSQSPTDTLVGLDVSLSAANQNTYWTLNNLFSVITRNITDGALRFQGFAAPSVSAAGAGSLYFDLSSNTFKVSVNGGAYATLASTAPAGSSSELQYRASASALGAVSNSSVSGGNVTMTGTMQAVIKDYGGQVFNAQAYGWLPDSTNHAVEALALLTTVYNAGGGTIYFPPSTGTYRCDSQLLIPNDGASPQPNQPSIQFLGAGANKQWYGVGASVLDLRYTSGDNNAKIETRGLGTLAISNLTIKDGGASNATRFVHSTNTTLIIEYSTFIGTGNVAQDAILLGGTSTTLSGLVNAPFQGYGTVIRSNHFRRGNRALYGLNYANGVVFDSNSFQANTGTVGVEFDGSNAGGQPCYGNDITNNLFEMDVYTYGIKLNLGKENLFSGNQFHDAGVGCLSFYYMDNLSTQNKIIGCVAPSSHALLTGQDVSTNATTIIDAQSGRLDPTGRGPASSVLTYGAVIQGSYDSTKDYPGPLTVASQFTPARRLALGMNDTTGHGIIDAKNGAIAVPLSVNATGGVLLSRFINPKTSDYVITAADTNTFFTNTGAAGAVIFTLPTPVAGMTYEIYRDFNQLVTVDVGGAVTIQAGASVTSAGGQVTLDAVGSKIRIVAITTAKWAADITGTATFS